MLDLKSLNWAVKQIAEEKGLQEDQVLGAVESAIAAAYKKEYCKKGEIVHAKLDSKSGSLKFWKTKTVVNENSVRIAEEEETENSQPTADFAFFGAGNKEKREEGLSEEEKLPRYNPDRHILIGEAKEIDPKAELGDELSFALEEHQDFGRIAAQTAKQVILQKIREAERDSIKKEYTGKEGEIVSGIVQRVERGNVFIDLGRAMGIVFFNETIPGERYKIGERLRFFVVAVQEEEGKKPGIILSRSHPKFVSKLFELEVPEIAEGLVEIKAITREAGNRTKIAVFTKEEGIDPIGACVGQRGTRVMAVNNELGNEKIDIIEWHEDPAKFIAAALSPAKVQGVEIMPRREAKVIVAEDQLSLAIGKDGQNARLAARLTGWKIDIRSGSRPDEVQFNTESVEDGGDGTTSDEGGE
ncbi:MAG: transcription termination factor NusA [Patescibacteria group bacterium]|nr:transcription termination factor NusA [Patescibacteria group bacterium]